MDRVIVAAAEDAAAAVVPLHKEDTNNRDGTRPRGPHMRRNVSPSPLQRRGRHHYRGSPPVIQRVIKESNGSTSWLMLT
jgi:hypothetical protein